MKQLKQKTLKSNDSFFVSIPVKEFNKYRQSDTLEDAISFCENNLTYGTEEEHVVLFATPKFISKIKITKTYQPILLG